LTTDDRRPSDRGASVVGRRSSVVATRKKLFTLLFTLLFTVGR